MPGWGSSEKTTSLFFAAIEAMAMEIVVIKLVEQKAAAELLAAAKAGTVVGSPD